MTSSSGRNGRGTPANDNDGGGEYPRRSPAKDAGAVPGSDKPTLPKRFYKVASVSDGDAPYRILLDGRGVRTPRKRQLEVASAELARRIAAEWDAQRELINPRTMPITRIVNSALDGVADSMPAVRSDIVAYSGNDMLCYRAETPATLVARQVDMWQPMLDWAEQALGLRLEVVAGVMPVEQSPDARAAVERAIAELDPVRLAALHVVTTLTGSTVLALGVLHGRLTADEAWRAAHLDEDFQIELWGEDGEARERRTLRWHEMDAASAILTLADVG